MSGLGGDAVCGSGCTNAWSVTFDSALWTQAAETCKNVPCLKLFPCQKGPSPCSWTAHTIQFCQNLCSVRGWFLDKTIIFFVSIFDPREHHLDWHLICPLLVHSGSFPFVSVPPPILVNIQSLGGYFLSAGYDSYFHSNDARCFGFRNYQRNSP